MPITNSQASKLNKSMRAAKDVALGTAIQNLTNSLQTSGSYSVVAGEASASLVVIQTGLTNMKGFVANVRRSGSPLFNMAAFSGSVAGTIVIKKDPTVTGSALNAGDVVTYFAF